MFTQYALMFSAYAVNLRISYAERPRSHRKQIAILSTRG